MSNTKKQKIIILLLFLAGSILYLSLIFNQNLWLDEAFSASLIRTDFSGVLKASAADTLPPLYNLLNKCMTVLLGYHPWVMKLTSVIPMVLVLFLGATTIRNRFGFLTSVIYIICMSGMPYLLYYGVEIRMYSLGLFFTTAAGIYAYEAYCSNNRLSWFFLLFFSLGAGYTHHFAFVSVGFVYLFLLLSIILQKRALLKAWFYLVIATVLLYLPCLIITLRQMKRVSGYFSMPDISLHFILQCLRSPFVTNLTPLSVLLLLLFIISFIIVPLYEKNVNTLFPALLGPLVFLGTLAFGALATIILHSNIFTDRYLIPSFGLLWLGFSVSLSACIKLTNSKTKYAISFLVLCILLCTVIKTYTLQFQSEYASGVNEMTKYFNENITSDDSYLIFEDNYQIEICFRYYFPAFKKTDWEHCNNVKGNLWYLMVPGFEQEMNQIKEHGYSAEKIKDFSFDRYSFTLYLLTKEK